MTSNRYSKPDKLINYLLNSNNYLADITLQSNLISNIARILNKHVSPAIQDHFTVASLKNNTLLLITDSATWAAKLRFHIPEILKTLNNEPDYSKIKSIRIKVIPENKIQQKHSRSPVYISDNASSILTYMSKTISDPELSKSFLKLASHTRKFKQADD